MNTINRRRFITLMSSTILLSSLSLISGCQGFKPQPFVTGRTITRPQGCSELLQRDLRGDC